MYKKKPLFVTFEGIEGSGKSYQSKKLYKSIKKKKIPVILTREPGGTRGAEKIRKIILDDYFYQDTQVKFNKSDGYFTLSNIFFCSIQNFLFNINSTDCNKS